MLSPDISRANNSQSALIQATKKRIKKKFKKKLNTQKPFAYYWTLSQTF